jgi:hypothetical protein
MRLRQAFGEPLSESDFIQDCSVAFHSAPHFRQLGIAKTMNPIRHPTTRSIASSTASRSSCNAHSGSQSMAFENPCNWRLR